MRIGVVGGGAAGMTAAIICAEGGARTVLFERNEKLGKKLYITGKGRCNLTNDCEASEFLENVVHGRKFLQSAIYNFPPAKTVKFFEDRGLSLITERGRRVFPESQKASDVIKTLANALIKSGVDIKLNCRVVGIARVEDGFRVETDRGSDIFDKVIIATGGLSYPSTGSTGDGYVFADSLGHKVVEPVCGLAPILTVEDVKSLQGLSLKNVSLTASGDFGRLSRFGELLFTDKGLSGPVALTLSSYINRSSSVVLSLDLKPALDAEKLDARILRDFAERGNQELKNVMRGLLPERLVSYALAEAGVPEWIKANSVSKKQRAALVGALKGLTFHVRGLAPFTEAVITAGGVDLTQLTPSMESRLVSNLYFIGEVADVDALTGGFNLQIAFSTAAAAAKHALGVVFSKIR